MLNKHLIPAFCAAAFLWYSSAASAESYKMYRYTDAKGKRVFVNSMDDVPAEFRLSASTVMVLKNVPSPDEENAAAAKKEEAAGDVKVLSLNVTSADNGKCGFTGDVKNEMKVRADAVTLHIDVKVKDQTRSFEIPVGAAGALNPGETVKVAYVADVPAADLAGYSFNVTWQTKREEAAPAKPAQQQPAPQVAAPKENPAPPPPAPAPVRRYRTRTHSAPVPPSEQ